LTDTKTKKPKVDKKYEQDVAQSPITKLHDLGACKCVTVYFYVCILWQYYCISVLLFIRIFICCLCV